MVMATTTRATKLMCRVVPLIFCCLFGMFAYLCQKHIYMYTLSTFMECISMQESINATNVEKGVYFLLQKSSAAFSLLTA